MRRRVPAGLLDAGFNSLATLAVGVAAASRLSPKALGVYALFFAAFNLLAIFPAQLVMVPYEVCALSVTVDHRVAILGRSLGMGALVGAIAAAGVPIAGLVVRQAVTGREFAYLAFTAAGCAVVSPMQDHLRRVFHLCGASWTAAAVSVIHAGVAVLAIGGLIRSGADPVLIPFGALVVANTVSLAAGFLLIIGRYRQAVVPDRPRSRELVSQGYQLVIYGLLPSGSIFVSSVVVTRLAGAEVLGVAEAARVIASPILVLAIGLSAVFSPRSMEAARRFRRDQAAEVWNLSASIIVISGVSFIALFGFDWQFNFLAEFVPVAYSVKGLVPTVVAGNVLMALAYPHRSELVAAGWQGRLLRVQVWSSAALIATAFTAKATDAFARPLGIAIGGIVRFVGHRIDRERLYRDGRSVAEESGDRPA